MKRLSARQASIKDPIITEAVTPEDIAVRRSRAGLQNEKRPIGSSLFFEKSAEVYQQFQVGRAKIIRY